MPLRGLMLGVALLAGAAAGCHKPTFPTVAGHTDVHVSSVEIEPRKGEKLELVYEPLLENLGLRADNAIRPERMYNPFRLAEDRRRVAEFAHEHGRFDVEVDEPELVWANDGKSVAVTWHVHEGVAYKIASVELLGAPPEHAALLREMIPFGPGDHVDLEEYRPLRRALAERLQDFGYGHARGYSRTFVDRDAKTVAWFYYLDPGPKTHIGKLVVEGNHRVQADAVLERAGLAPGGEYSTTEKRRAELALLDSGAFASAIVLSDADIQSGPPEHPDTGGALAPDQVDADGKLVPRHLSDTLDVRVIVVEAPAKQVRLELGIEADPTRADAYAGARVTLRNLFATQHHLVLEATAGYGRQFGDGHEPALGVYGSALAQYLHPGWIARDLDLRMTGRWRDILYPSVLLREIVAGPGVRSTVARGVFVDLDVWYRFGRALDLPALDAMTVAQLQLPTDTDAKGVEVQASVIVDRRDDRVEATRGWLFGVRGSYSPGGPLADHRWLQLGVDGRAYHPLNGAWSVGVRASSAWVVLAGDNGVPLGPRLFGGGAFGMRGFGRDHLAPSACAMDSPAGGCDRVYVGGTSLVEASAELRFLPFRKQYGLTTFVDAGGAAVDANAFANGVSAAVGIGGRLRLWYVPVSIDVAYRFLEDNDFGVSGGFDRLLLFFRVGEAF